MKNHGFTLIELLVVIAIISIIGFSIVPISVNFFTRNLLKDKTSELTSLLRTAQISSISAKEDSAWGVNISTNNMTIYKGNSFVLRDTAFDKSFEIPSSITIDQADISFSKNVGNPTSARTLNIRNNYEEIEVITINELGIVDVN